MFGLDVIRRYTLKYPEVGKFCTTDCTGVPILDTTDLLNIVPSRSDIVSSMKLTIFNGWLNLHNPEKINPYPKRDLLG